MFYYCYSFSSWTDIVYYWKPDLKLSIWSIYIYNYDPISTKLFDNIIIQKWCIGIIIFLLISVVIRPHHCINTYYKIDKARTYLYAHIYSVTGVWYPDKDNLFLYLVPSLFSLKIFLISFVSIITFLSPLCLHQILIYLDLYSFLCLSHHRLKVSLVSSEGV